MFAYVVTLSTLMKLFRNHTIHGDLIKLIHSLATANARDAYEFLIKHVRENFDDGIIRSTCNLEGILNSCNLNHSPRASLSLSEKHSSRDACLGFRFPDHPSTVGERENSKSLIWYEKV